MCRPDTHALGNYEYRTGRDGKKAAYLLWNFPAVIIKGSSI